MTRLTEIAPRLEKLLLLLSSNQPGEVVAAAHAINRALQAAGADWHDLAAALSTKQRDSNSNTDGNVGWRTAREFCLRRSHQLSERELEFVAGLGKWHGDLTKKQQDWLASIYERVSA